MDCTHSKGKPDERQSNNESNSEAGEAGRIRCYHGARLCRRPAAAASHIGRAGKLVNRRFQPISKLLRLLSTQPRSCLAPVSNRIVQRRKRWTNRSNARPRSAKSVGSGTGAGAKEATEATEPLMTEAVVGTKTLAVV